MSGEESLAQVNREIAYPKVKNLVRAGFIIFLYSMLMTGADLVLRGPDHSRRRAHERLQRQPDRRPRHVRGRAAVGAPGAARLRRRSSASSSSPAPSTRPSSAPTACSTASPRTACCRTGSAIRIARYGTTVPPHQPGRRAADLHHHRQPRRRLHARRGLRLRRRVELRLQGAVDGGAALQGPPAARLEGAVQSARRRRSSCRSVLSLIFLVLLVDGAGQPGDQEGGDRVGHRLHRSSSSSSSVVSERLSRRAAHAGAACSRSSTSATRPSSIPARIGLDGGVRKLVPVRDPQNLSHLDRALEGGRARARRRRRADGQGRARPCGERRSRTSLPTSRPSSRRS